MHIFENADVTGYIVLQLIERKNVHRTDYDVDFYVTGSNSRMMSSEIATYLTGRYVSFGSIRFLFRNIWNSKSSIHR